MAEGGSFNIAALVRRLGLKAVAAEDLRVLQTIQPVLPVGNLSDFTPPFVSASAMFAETVLGIAGGTGFMQLQCLAPGGGFIDWFQFRSGFSNGRMRVSATDLGGAVSTTVGQTSREPVVSIVTSGSNLLINEPGVHLSENGIFIQFGLRPIFVPRGSFFQMQLIFPNLNGDIGFGWREVPAAENE